jgi:hypothetical protein
MSLPPGAGKFIELARAENNMRVLLAIDPSSGSQHVVNEAAARPWPTGTAFCVLSIVDMGRWEGLPTLAQDAKQAARVLVEEAVKELDHPGIEVFSDIQLGYPKKADPGFCSGMESRPGHGWFPRTQRGFPILPRQCRAGGSPLCALLRGNRTILIRGFAGVISCHEDPPLHGRV